MSLTNSPATRERIESVTNKLAIALGKRMNVDPVDIVQDIEPALTALCEEMEREKWLPIADAPKDQKVLVTRFPASGKPPVMIAWFSSSELRNHCRPWKINHFKKLRWDPTHFQPLPQPPAT